MDYLTDDSNEVQSYFTTHHIPIYFYQCLFGELVKIFGFNLSTQSLELFSEEMNYVTGTRGWNVAFKEACTQCNLADMYEYYNSLDWCKSDIFDGIIEEKMTNVLFDSNVRSEYYTFKIQKEK